jgi:hypothetical protein
MPESVHNLGLQPCASGALTGQPLKFGAGIGEAVLKPLMKDAASFLCGGNGNGAAVPGSHKFCQQFSLGPAVTYDGNGGILAEIERGRFEHVFRRRKPELSLRDPYLLFGITHFCPPALLEAVLEPRGPSFSRRPLTAATTTEWMSVALISMFAKPRRHRIGGVASAPAAVPTRPSHRQILCNVPSRQTP